MMAQSPQKIKELRLPISRVKTIMKSSQNVDTVGQDGLLLVAKATEMFIHHLTTEAYSKSNRASNLDYKHLAEVVQTDEKLHFLKEIMPRKITVRQFKQMMAAKEAIQDSSSDTSDSDNDSDSASRGDTESASGSDLKKDNVNNNTKSSRINSNSESDSEQDSSTSEMSTKSASDEEDD